MDTTDDIRKHVRVYLAVFAALAVLTVVTVLASIPEVSPATGVVIALLIATIKGSLVAGYFMHLLSERKTILMILVFTVIVLIVMLLVPTVTETGALVSDHVS